MQRLVGWIVAALVSVDSVAAVAAENWPRFRGADGSGVVPEQGLPVQWSATDYAWAVDIPGEGHGAPAIWGDTLFVTSAIDDGRLRSLFALSVKTGKTLWAQSIGLNTHRKHAKNSFASSTPATDGERVYVAFADQERYALAAYDFQGELLWRTWLGPFTSQHGLGASPIVFEDLVIMPNDQDGPSAMVALDRRNGRLVWSTLRAFREASYATPLIIEPPGSKPQLICVSGATGITSLDPWTGNLNWQSEPLPQRTVACPAYHQGRIYATCGQGGKGTLMIGVDVSTQTDGGVVPTVFKREKSLPYVPTIISYGEFLYLWNDNGTVLCLDPKKDEIVWQERLGGNFSGSPICVGGKLYCLEESGKAVVVDANPTFQQRGITDLGDPSHSTPAVANGRMYLRTFHRLLCITAPKSTAGGN